MLNQWVTQASVSKQANKFDLAGIVSFYDVSPQSWRKLIDSNPSGRKGYGLIFTITHPLVIV